MSMSELAELGLLPARMPGRCEHWIEKKMRWCSQPALPGVDLCAYHGGDAALRARTAGEVREQILKTLIPTAVQRLYEIVSDPDEKSENVIRAAFGLMDRVGIGPVSGLVVDAAVEHRAPLELLAEALERVSGALTRGEARVLEGEVVAESRGADSPPAA